MRASEKNVRIGDVFHLSKQGLGVGKSQVIQSHEITKLLIERFAELNAKDDEGKTPLHFACMLGNLSMVKLLLSRPECIVDPQDNAGDTPLHMACSSLNDPIIRYLLQTGKSTASGIKNNEQKSARDVLNLKSKQAGQLTRFIDLIDAMEDENSGAAQSSEPQERGRNRI